MPKTDEEVRSMLIATITSMKKAEKNRLDQLRKDLKERIIRKVNVEFKDFISGVQYPEEGYNLILKEFENVIDSVFSAHEVSNAKN